MAMRHKTSNRYDASSARTTMGIKSVTAEKPCQRLYFAKHNFVGTTLPMIGV